MIHKKAFTMIELVFIIIILGILTASALPMVSKTCSTQSNVKQIEKTKVLEPSSTTTYLNEN